MSLAYIAKSVLPASLWMLPDKMDNPNARLLLLAIGLQESKFLYRRQINGPARGFFQFEKAGISGVLRHASSGHIIKPILAQMQYDETVDTSHAVIEHNDILACIYARLLLWTDAAPLPYYGNEEGAWDYYLRNWRPGKPRKEHWHTAYNEALAVMA